jgi:hypothetical protein
LSLADAAKGILSDAHGKTGAQRLDELEDGNRVCQDFGVNDLSFKAAFSLQSE